MDDDLAAQSRQQTVNERDRFQTVYHLDPTLCAALHDMAYQHGHARLVRRQRGRQEEDDDETGVTVIEIITVPQSRATRTAPATTNAPKTLVPPAVATRPMSTATEDDNDDETTTARPTAASTSRKPAATSHTTESKAEETSTVRSINDQSTLMVATKSPTASNSGSLVGALVSATASVSATISATPTSGASESESEGMSGGAKAGLALGILVGVAALLAGILFVYRRKKNAIAAQKDNEKIGMHNAPAPLPPQVPTGAAAAAAPSIRTNRTMSTAPRLSLRPVTQFDPTFNEQRKSGGNLLSVAAAAAPVTAAHDRAPSSEERPVSAWERRGAANAGNDGGAAPAANPFNDPQTPANSQPPANPFGNSAALDAAHAAIPDSPPQMSPQHSAAPSTDLDARLAPASMATPATVPGVDAAAVATAMASVPVSEHDFPAPPSVNANANSVPPSPAWTEDVPSSPAMGTPMIAGAAGAAGAMAAGRPNGPPGGPNNVHRVQLDFKPSMGDELELKAGTLVRMLHEYDDGWVSLL